MEPASREPYTYIHDGNSKPCYSFNVACVHHVPNEMWSLIFHNKNNNFPWDFTLVHENVLVFSSSSYKYGRAGRKLYLVGWESNQQPSHFQNDALPSDLSWERCCCPTWPCSRLDLAPKSWPYSSDGIEMRMLLVLFPLGQLEFSACLLGHTGTRIKRPVHKNIIL